MYPSNLFQLVDVPDLQALLGTPVRIYPIDEVPSKVAVPYVAHQLITAAPDNNVDDPPEIDDERIQWKVWAAARPGQSATDVATGIAKVLRSVLEQHGTVNSYGTTGPDPTTGRCGYFIDWSRLETTR